MRLRLFVCLAILALGLLAGASAYADDIQIVCTGSTTCNSGGIQTTSSTSPTFNVQTSGNVKTANELYIAILDPSTSGSFTSADKSLWADQGLTGGQDHNFPSTVSNDGGFFTGADNSFQVTLFDTGDTLGSMSSVSVTLPAGSYPDGTIFVAFTADNGSVIVNTPWSESLLITGPPTSTPEPSTFLLSLLGVISIAGLAALRKI